MSLACTSQHCTRLLCDTLTSIYSLSLLPPARTPPPTIHCTSMPNIKCWTVTHLLKRTHKTTLQKCVHHFWFFTQYVCVCVCVVVIVRYPFTLLPHRCPSHCLTPVWWVPVCQSQCGLWQWCLWLQFCLL